MKVLGGTSAKNAKLRSSKRNSSGKALRNKTKAKEKRKKTRSAKFGESSGQNNEEAIIKRVTKLLGDVSVESQMDFEEETNVFQDLDLIILG